MSVRRNRRRRRRAKAEAALSKLSLGEEEEEPRRILDILALRRSLRGKIRGHYLDAISRLPTAELNTTLARGLLVAGHCYGPLHPVDNILLNSIWYSAAFPLRADDRIDVAVINKSILTRLVQHSLDGLVACLRHHCPRLSDDDALWHLSLSGADLRAAVASARGAAPSLLPPTEPEAFQAAATAARHPKPAALALFACSVIPSVERDAVSLLNSKHRLSSADILRLSAMVLPSPVPDELPHPPLQERYTAAFKLIARRRKLLIRMYIEWVQLADAALSKYAKQTGEHYLLHIIYGEGALQDEFNMDESYHISFMAWPKDPSCCASRKAPVFFFAEAIYPSGSEFSEEDITLCCMVQPSRTEVDSCQVCLNENLQVDHPDDTANFGGGQYYNIDGIGKDLDCPITSDVDYRCFDPDRDIDFVEYLDQDFTSYTLASPWNRCHKDDIDSAILYYCQRYT